MSRKRVYWTVDDGEKLVSLLEQLQEYAVDHEQRLAALEKGDIVGVACQPGETTVHYKTLSPTVERYRVFGFSEVPYKAVAVYYRDPIGVVVATWEQYRKREWFVEFPVVGVHHTMSFSEGEYRALVNLMLTTGLWEKIHE